MSSIPDTLRRIAEQIATLEAERARLISELVGEDVGAGSPVIDNGDGTVKLAPVGFLYMDPGDIR